MNKRQRKKQGKKYEEARQAFIAIGRACEQAAEGLRGVFKKIKAPSKERGCSGKIQLGEDYIKQAERLSAKHGKSYGVYRCPHCNSTHLTTKLSNASRYAKLLYKTVAKG